MNGSFVDKAKLTAHTLFFTVIRELKVSPHQKGFTDVRLSYYEMASSFLYQWSSSNSTIC